MVKLCAEDGEYMSEICYSQNSNQSFKEDYMKINDKNVLQELGRALSIIKIAYEYSGIDFGSDGC